MGDFFTSLPWFKILLLVVGLMSGILSVIREFLTVNHPEKINEKRLFWRCVIYAFIFSFVVLWVLERETNISLTKQMEASQKPDFRVVIAQITGNYNSDGVTVFLIQMGVFNKGADSVLASIGAHYKSDTLDRDADVLYLAPQAEERAFPEEPDTEDRSVPSMRSVGMITRGALVPGKLFVSIPGDRRKEMKDNPTVLTVIVRDYQGATASGS